MDMNFRIRYCHIVVENTWVVWLEGPHRFIQFKEPAFFVFEEWASGQEPQAIANNCTERYGLPQEEAVRFVGEIISETEKLFKAEVKVKIKKETVKPNKAEVEAKIKAEEAELKRIHSEYLCRIGGKTILFRYGDEVMEEAFRPLFEQFEQSKVEVEVKDKKKKVEVKVEVGKQNKDEVKVEAKISGETLPEVSKEDEVIENESRFEAPLKTKDLRLKTSTDPEKVPLLYPLPVAISVKKNAIPILAKWYPALEKEMVDAAEEESYETYLPLTGNAGDLSPIPAKAIFFVQYDPMVDFRLTRESNLEKMNDFLKLSWIPRNRGAAQAFLEWYFSLPVYSLVYSDPEKLVKGVTFLPTI